jgi:hypothetical protein
MSFALLFGVGYNRNMGNMGIDDLPVSPNEGQKNMDQISNSINDLVGDRMGKLQDSEPGGRHFLNGEHSLFGYNGVVVTGGKITSLVDLDGSEYIPPVSLGTEVTIVGDSHDYVSSGHKPGDRVTVIRLIEPFYMAAPGLQSSDKIIKVEGEGVIGWIKPSELNKTQLREDLEKEVQKLFVQPTKNEG